MNLDNVQNAEVFANIEKQLRMIQCLCSVVLGTHCIFGTKENFQKKLWTKKKFVVSVNYLITLDSFQKAFIQKFVSKMTTSDQCM